MTSATEHTIVLGAVGTGKTEVLLAIATEALSNGHDLVPIDVVGEYRNFAPTRSKVDTWADPPAAALAAVDAVASETQRRYQVMRDRGAARWTGKPLTVLIVRFDELISRADRVTRARILTVLGDLARGSRIAGVQLIIDLEHLDPSVLPLEIQANLEQRVSLP